MARLVVRCPAKVNLHLEVLGRRADGYHELRTLFAPVGIWDELTLEEAPHDVLELTVEPPGVAPGGGENLVVRAARALQRAMPVRRGARLLLRKAIPVAGGLGGGSSDAAGALVGLASLWGLGSSFASLQNMAASLGADVPFFLLGGAVWGVGRGSEVYPLADLPRWWVVIVPGESPVPTAEVYGALPAAGVDERPAGALYHWVVAGGELPIAACRNELEPTVVARWPGVARRLAAVRTTRPLLASLSGSGGAVFGLYENEGAAANAAGELAHLAPLLAAVLPRAASLLRPSAEEAAWKSPKSAST